MKEVIQVRGGKDEYTFRPRDELPSAVNEIKAQGSKSEDGGGHHERHPSIVAPQEAFFTESPIGKEHKDEERDKTHGIIGIETQANGQSTPDKVRSLLKTQTPQEEIESQKLKKRCYDAAYAQSAEVYVPMGDGQKGGGDHGRLFPEKGSD
jgi:hypothetical protein